MKRIAALLIAALLMVPSIAIAKGGLYHHNMDDELRETTFCGRYYVNAGDHTATAAGTKGVIANMIVYNNSTPTQTSSIATMPWPAKISARLVDVSADDVLTCTSLAVEGWDQNGTWRTETLSTLTETATVTSTYVYGVVTKLTGSTCYEGGFYPDGATATDHIRVWVDTEVGLRRRIKSYKDVESFCFFDASASWAAFCAKSKISGTSAADIEDAIGGCSDCTTKGEDSSIDLDQSSLTALSVANGDQWCITVRPSWKSTRGW